MARILLSLALVLVAIAIMAVEGHHQRSPGIGFGIAFGLILLAALTPKRSPE